MRGLRAASAVLFALLALGAGKRPPGLGDVVEVDVYDHPTYTRVVVELSRQTEYRTGTIGNPPRFYIDIEDTWIEKPLGAPQHETDTEALRRVRGGQNTLTQARVVLELDTRNRAHRTFHLQKPFRIVTDVFVDSVLPPANQPPGGPVRDFDERPVRRIAIDPGHGGKDPGALGSGGLREKDIVLRVSRELERQLDQKGFDAFLTRDRDTYLTLEQRTEIANRAQADLFVSVHANASPRRSTHGVETFLLDTRYDRQTARVAARENGTTVGQLSSLQRILASLRLGYNERFAARAAGHVQDSLIDDLRRNQHKNTQDLGVKRGPFLVLFMADMPAILVEVGFVSNRAEGRRMRTKQFSSAAANGIARGVVRYRDEHARSLVAQNR